MVVLEQNWLYLCEVVVFWQCGGIRAKMFVIGQSDCIGAKVVEFNQKWLHSGKVVLFEQNLL